MIIRIAVIHAVEEVHAPVSSDLSEYVDPGSKRNDSQKNLNLTFLSDKRQVWLSYVRSKCTAVEEGCQSRTKGVKQSLEWAWQRSRARVRGHKGWPVPKHLAVVFQCHIVPRACFPIPLHALALEACQRFFPTHQRSIVHLAAAAVLLEMK